MIEPHPTTPAPQHDARAPQPPLLPHDPMIVLGYRCMRREIDTLAARGSNGGAAPSGDDVHRMRIAIRRLRVALRLFGHMLPHSAEPLDAELRWLARALGTARDLDVHAAELREHKRTTAAELAQQLGDYELELRRQQATARKAVRELLTSDRYRGLLATLDAVVGSGPSAGALRRFKSFRIRDGAAKHLRRSRKRVLKLGRKLDAEAEAEDLHRLRIRAKRLRYELEFFVEPYPELAAATAAVKALQDVLGADRDATLGAARLADYRRKLRGRRRDVAAPTAALDDWAARQADHGQSARHRLPVVWRDLVRALRKSRLPALE